MKMPSAKFGCARCAANRRNEPQILIRATRSGEWIDVTVYERREPWVAGADGKPFWSTTDHAIQLYDVAPPGELAPLDVVNIELAPCGHGPFTIAGGQVRAAIEQSARHRNRASWVSIAPL